MLNRKQTRRFFRHLVAKCSHSLKWILIAPPAILAGLVQIVSQKNHWWPWVLWAGALAQIAKDMWSENKGKRRIESGDFFKAYIAHTIDLMALTPDVSTFSPQASRLVQSNVLQTICALVATYHQEKDNGKVRAKFNASVMVVEGCDAWIETQDGNLQFKSSVRFWDVNRGLQACDNVLHLTCWAEEPENWQPFVLPIDKDDDYLLPGAPRACAEKQMQIVSDTDELWNNDVAKHAITVKRELRDYCESNEQSLRSFFCLPLESEGRIIGILNVQSKSRDILGIDKEHSDDLELCLRPFCALLVSLLERERLATLPNAG